MKRLPSIVVLVIASSVGCKSPGRFDTPVSDAAKANAFVVEFYAWYNPRPDSTRRYFDVLTQRRTALTPDLEALLDSDLACATRSHEICNLDSDPFVNSQDPCGRYEVGGSIAHHDTVGVSVFGVCGGKRDTIPAVVAMVVRHDSTWQFADFAYPTEHTTLHALLAGKATR